MLCYLISYPLHIGEGWPTVGEVEEGPVGVDALHSDPRFQALLERYADEAEH